MKPVFQTTCAHPAAQLACRELDEMLARFFAGCKAEGGDIRLAVQTPENLNVDEYEIDVDLALARGHIVASNPRALLFGAYRLLRELGFRWIRPGANGEIVPPRPKKLPYIRLNDRAVYRFRGVCIEGAVSLENVLEFLRWMVKLGLNTYFVQFRDAYTFFARWYAHEENPLLPAEPFDDERAKRLTRMVRDEVKSLGLELQMVGHGWTCEPFGIRGDGWYVSGQRLSAEQCRILAEVCGKRELWGGIALNTNLCYGQAAVRRKLARAIVEYARANPDIDVLHFWLADAANNHCECPLCTKKRPADWYVDILNEADRLLTKAGLPVRIVFLVYCDLLWPPERSKIADPRRFILMFAPITRSYSRPFSAETGERLPLPPYVRNGLELPKSPGENLVFLEAWQKRFSGPGFDFDYHYMWDHYKDAGGMRIARVLYDDCRNLRGLGLDGMVSCQTQRAFYPHALGMAVLGEALWNPGRDFSAISFDYFRAAYGSGGKAAQRYFEEVSAIFDPRALRGELNPTEYAAMLTGLMRYEVVVKRIAPVLARGLASRSAARRQSWRELELHMDICHLLADFLRACPLGKVPAEQALARLVGWAQKHETELQSVFDVFEYITTFRDRILPRMLKALSAPVGS